MLSLLSEKGIFKKFNTVEPDDILCSVRPFVCTMIRSAMTLGLCIIIISPVSSFADIYRYKDKKGKWHYTNVKSDVRYTFYMKEARENPDAFIKKYDSIISQASEKFSLEPSLVKAVIKAESGFDHKAVSSKGARGLMQLMPDTADDMAVDDPFNPTQNIFGGTRYLSKLMERYKNNIKHVLAAYNAGPEKVDQYKGVPPYEETKTFIKRVMDYYKQYQSSK